jgi:hypothetical protein
MSAPFLRTPFGAGVGNDRWCQRCPSRLLNDFAAIGPHLLPMHLPSGAGVGSRMPARRFAGIGLRWRGIGRWGEIHAEDTARELKGPESSICAKRRITASSCRGRSSDSMRESELASSSGGLWLAHEHAGSAAMIKSGPTLQSTDLAHNISRSTRVCVSATLVRRRWEV